MRGLRLAACCCALLTGGCGFHLAGQQPLPEPLTSVYIDMVNPYRVATPPLETALQARIVARNGQVKSDESKARSVLRLSELSETLEALAVGLDGVALEYRLVTHVTFELHDHDRVLVPAHDQSVSRDYSFNVTAVLAKEEEEDRLRNYMQNELAELILLRLEADLNRAATAPAPVSVPASTPAAPTPANTLTVPPAAAPAS